MVDANASSRGHPPPSRSGGRAAPKRAPRGPRTTGPFARTAPGCRLPWCHGTRVRRECGGAQVAAPLGRRGHLPDRQRRPPGEVLRAVHVPLPLGAGAPGPRQELHLRRPDRPLPDHAGKGGSEPDRLRLLRPAGRERRHQDRHPPPALHRRPDRRAQRVAPAPRCRLRLAPRGAQPRPRLHQVEPAHLPALLGGRPGLPGHGPGQLVPRVPDGPGQRAGPGRRHLRALRRRRRQARPGAMVLPHHPVRRRAPRGAGRPRMARAGQDHAAQLDRAVRGGRVRPRRSRGAPTSRCGCSPPGPTRASA